MKQFTVFLIIMQSYLALAQAADPPKIEMIHVNGGCFRMGDTSSDVDDVKPVHKVCLDDFSIGMYEVTQAQWLMVMGENPSDNQVCGDNCPVENVSWDDVQEFISKLNQKTGLNYRLPYEAEWEYAARSGGKNNLWAGTNDPEKMPDYLWWAGNSNKSIHPAGQKKPNEIGLYDMSGNVWEWCLDWYDAKYYKKSPQKNPHGPRTGTERVARGGSLFCQAAYVLTTNRLKAKPDNLYNGTIGFRLALPGAK